MVAGRRRWHLPFCACVLTSWAASCYPPSCIPQICYLSHAQASTQGSAAAQQAFAQSYQLGSELLLSPLASIPQSAVLCSTPRMHRPAPGGRGRAAGVCAVLPAGQRAAAEPGTGPQRRRCVGRQRCGWGWGGPAGGGAAARGGGRGRGDPERPPVQVRARAGGCCWRGQDCGCCGTAE